MVGCTVALSGQVDKCNPTRTRGSGDINGHVPCQAAKAWGEEEKMTLRTRERQVQEAEERADELLRSAAADIDNQSQALQQHRQALEQVSCH